MENCIFCKIIKKQVPSKVIYETDNCIVFLTTGPVSYGHALVVPKQHYENVADTPDDVLKDIIVTAKRIGEVAKSELKATGYNILNASGIDAQQSVFHLHFHVVPRYPSDALDLWFHCENNKNISNEEVHNHYLKGFINKNIKSTNA